MRKFFAATALAATVLAAPATASTIIDGSYYYSLEDGINQSPQANESLVCTFETNDCGFTGDFIIQAGSNSLGAAPAGDLTRYLSVPGTLRSGSAMLDVSSLMAQTFSFLWGSIDDYNSVTWVSNTGFTTTVFGDDLITTNLGNQQSPISNRRFFGGVFDGTYIDSITFSSNGRAFEVDDIAFDNRNIGAVPEPGTWAMLILGFLGVGYIMRKRGKQNTLRVRYT